ncbi:MAG: ankyrin repeat domain-containing protein [Gemmataceae bacterium]|nr:ankyrin repeat domain-containing protein [Gemmataceae bacterium]MCI0737976.1 ankyrin repeat domain-containing protein [Gemmataceae bacterium]
MMKLCFLYLAAVSLPCGVLVAAQPDEVIERLVKQLGSDDFREREQATKQLKETGRPALKALRNAAASNDAEVRRRAEQLVLAILRIRPVQNGLDDELAERCFSGNAEQVAHLLGQGASPHASRRGKRPVLCIAADQGNLRIMRLLLDHGADANAESTMGYSALREAAGNSDVGGVKMLLDAGAEPDPAALGHACWLGRTEVVKLLLDIGVSPDSGLPQAAQAGNFDLVTLLLAKGANVNTKSKDGATALHLGALQGGFETVKLLLDKGADPNALNDQGQTPLHMAISRDCELPTIKLLVQIGAKLDIPDKEGRTPIRLALEAGPNAKRVHDWLTGK